jgi:hypothetical protein
MGLGKITTPIGGMEIQGDASFTYGFGIAADYRIIGGFSAGIAPQHIYNVNYKVNPSQVAPTPAVTETDYLLRLAYTFQVEDSIGLYVEALPGYSHLNQTGGDPATGFALGVGGGADMAFPHHIFATVGGGYQWGFQSLTVAGDKFDARTRYVRVNLGTGVRF